MEANREAAKLVLEKARDAMAKEPYSERPMELLLKAERMHPSDEVKKAIVDWQAISDVFALRHDARALLGMSTNTTEAELQNALERLSQRVHPDKNHAPRAAEAFQIVQNAFKATRAALVGGAPPKSAPVALTIQIECDYCAQRLDVQIPAHALRSAPSVWPPVFSPFPACCCYCKKVIQVCAQPLQNNTFPTTRNTPWHDVQQQQKPPPGGRQNAPKPPEPPAPHVAPKPQKPKPVAAGELCAYCLQQVGKRVSAAARSPQPWKQLPTCSACRNAANICRE